MAAHIAIVATVRTWDELVEYVGRGFQAPETGDARTNLSQHVSSELGRITAQFHAVEHDNEEALARWLTALSGTPDWIKVACAGGCDLSAIEAALFGALEHLTPEATEEENADDHDKEDPEFSAACDALDNLIADCQSGLNWDLDPADVYRQVFRNLGVDAARVEQIIGDDAEHAWERELLNRLCGSKPMAVHVVRQALKEVVAEQAPRLMMG